MFVLVVYDVPADRTSIYRKLLRKRLNHIQYSVFYGDLTPGQLEDVKHDIESKLIPEDSIIIFEADAVGFVDHTTYGDTDDPDSRFT
ncbi:CRISPR-associated endonuclease Cas2 [Halorubellus sp. PRR65]|uniref:CRISPR-associated endonuclease Cas2 n=1 Tax=Halorubellus sp. PRR65 TaxID=3098148 RepID=UPI002B25AA0C|nr:CRISPR-associated endonuclease Cas2 [Halorubellus sp. PRR65]